MKVCKPYKRLVPAGNENCGSRFPDTARKKWLLFWILFTGQHYGGYRNLGLPFNLLYVICDSMLSGQLLQWFPDRLAFKDMHRYLKTRFSHGISIAYCDSFF